MADRSRRNRALAAPPDESIGTKDDRTVTGSGGAAPSSDTMAKNGPAARTADAGAKTGRGDAPHRPPAWAFVTGALFGGLTLLFFMALVLLAAFDRPIPCESRFLVVIVLALGGALASSFIGGSAAAKGEIPLQIATRNPVGFSVVGGIAVMLLLMIAGHFGYQSSCTGVASEAVAPGAPASTPEGPPDVGVSPASSRP